MATWWSSTFVARSRSDAATVVTRSGATSVVYFVQGEHGGPIKVGYTSSASIDRRLAQMQTGSPARLRAVLTIEGDTRAEAWLHRLFAADWIHGEWYQPSGRLVDWIIDHGGDAALVHRDRLRSEPDAVDLMPTPHLRELEDTIHRELRRRERAAFLAVRAA